MDFSTMLQDMRNSTPQEKTASASQKTADQAAKTALDAALEKTAAPVTSASPDAVDSLLKMASMLAEQEKQAELVHAAQCGRVMADAMLEAFASADALAKTAALQDAQSKYAAAPGVAYDPTLDAMVKAAAEAGYNETREKIAAEQFQEGQQAALDAVYKTAQEEFLKGDAEVETLARQAYGR
jgi:hypothetical protein